MPSKTLNQKSLVRIFKDARELSSSETRFCFLLGAGASKSSNIPTGWELSKRWFDELSDDLEGNEFESWKSSIGLTEEKLGEFYTHIYEKRYESNPQLGYEYFKHLMEDKEPSIGYVILSQILASEQHNFVITTNFDYLVEDAVRMYTNTKPFSAGHETLAGFISSQTKRPTIIKVHRDLFLNPMNDAANTSKLKKEWQEALKPILRNFNLLVIGYGGNDGSLMDYLSGIPVESRKPIYWCTRETDSLNSKVTGLLSEKDLSVKIDSFDSLMYELYGALNYKFFNNLDDSLNHPFVKNAIERNHRLKDKREKLIDLANNNRNTGKSSENLENILTDDSLLYNNILQESDPKKQEDEFQKAIQTYPNSVLLLGGYANFLNDVKKDYGAAKKVYEKAIDLDPQNAVNLGNYANVLYSGFQDYDTARSYYQKAIELDPHNSITIGNYAMFIENVEKHYDKAENLYLKAIELDPDDAINAGNYAVFLQNARKKFELAEEYYKKAILLDPENANNLGNYAILLENTRKDMTSSEEYYKKSVELDPKNANNVGNYALFLQNATKDYPMAEELFKKAFKIDPSHVNNSLNYVYFLNYVLNDYERTEQLYKEILKISPQNSDFLESYALFLSHRKKDYAQAEEYYRQIVELDPENANNLGNYAHFKIISEENLKEAKGLIDSAFRLNEETSSLSAELWFYRYAHYREYLDEGKKQLQKLIDSGINSLEWDFNSHVEIAKRNGHPDIDQLNEFALKLGEEITSNIVSS